MIFEVNNGRKIRMEQTRPDGAVTVLSLDSKGISENAVMISPGDMVTLLNWYRYQKENGNSNLTF